MHTLACHLLSVAQDSSFLEALIPFCPRCSVLKINILVQASVVPLHQPLKSMHHCPPQSAVHDVDFLVCPIGAFTVIQSRMTQRCHETVRVTPPCSIPSPADQTSLPTTPASLPPASSLLKILCAIGLFLRTVSP